MSHKERIEGLEKDVKRLIEQSVISEGKIKKLETFIERHCGDPNLALLDPFLH